MKNSELILGFASRLDDEATISEQKIRKYRLQKLGAIKVEGLDYKYCIAVSLLDEDEKGLLLEYDQYKNFKRTSNRYTHHPANPDILVKGHYHVYPRNSKIEIYAVNMDGTAHHKKNKGYKVPKKEAEELRTFGVSIPMNRIIENRQTETDSKLNQLTCILLLIE